MGKYGTWFLALLSFVLPLALYVKTLAPTYIPIDSAEFALCFHFWGVCHPPGFPLYTLLGKLFTDLWPFGTLIYKANLLSAFLGSLTILVVYLDLRLLKVGEILAFLLAIFLAVSQIFWEFSLSADVFTFATFLLALSIFLAFKKRVFLAFFVLGLSASHFYISAVLWPLFVWLTATNESNKHSFSTNKHSLQSSPAVRGAGLKSNWSNSSNWQKLKFLLTAGFFFALGFFPQALMYWRMQQSPQINWGYAQGISGFVDFVRRKEFGSIFLIANPVLTFSLFKVFKHFWVYFTSLFVQFGIVLPVLGITGMFFSNLLRDRKIQFLVFSFFIIVIVQLTLLSTIDPLEKGSPFQINKFYLSSFVFAVLILGVAIDNLAKKFFGQGQQAALLIFLLIIVYFFANFRVNDYSNNYFSQNLVLDALSQLPDNSVAITVGHVFYFGSLYEQKVNGKFTDVDLLYFPNEKNRDGEKYKPRLFTRTVDSQFVSSIRKDKKLGNAEGYILETISRNLDRPIYILQGTFEENFFGYLKPYITPYGLWWKIEKDPFGRAVDSEVNLEIIDNLRNAELTTFDLRLKQQKDDLLTYAVSYHSAGVYLAAVGFYDEALAMFEKSLAVNPDAKNVLEEIELVKKTQKLDAQEDELFIGRDKEKLYELGNNLFTLGNYRRCGQIFGKMAEIWVNDAQIFNNAGSCYANAWQIDPARASYQKAIDLDPDLEKARIGLEELER